MSRSYVLAVCALYAVVLTARAPVVADYFDDFADDSFWQNEPNTSWQFPPDPQPPFDPNYLDIDNPHWRMYGVIGDFWYSEVHNGWLWIFADSTIVPYTAFAAGPDDGTQDPNTSVNWYDDSAPHYIVAKALVKDPNQGEAALIMHASDLYWTLYAVDLEVDDRRFTIANGNGTNWSAGGKYQVRWDLDTDNGFWMVLQLDGDGDPNNTWLRCAAWNGNKHDWNGVWDIEQHAVTAWDPNGIHGYYEEGMSGCLGVGSPQAGTTLVDGKFDEFEVRWGTFSHISHTLELTVKNPQHGTVTINPDLLDDPNHASSDPNIPADPNELRRYTDGIEIVMVAEALSGKSFKEWKIYDPNYPGDSNHATKDTNATLYLTMDADWEIEASFKCGSSDALLPLALVLMALALGVVVRRLA